MHSIGLSRDLLHLAASRTRIPIAIALARGQEIYNRLRFGLYVQTSVYVFWTKDNETIFKGETSIVEDAAVDMRRDITINSLPLVAVATHLTNAFAEPLMYSFKRYHDMRPSHLDPK